MTTVAIRQSGGAAIVSLPKAVLNLMHLAIGDGLDLKVEAGAIVLRPIHHEMTLDELLAGSPREAFRPLPEDKVWLEQTMGREEI